jgi:predicted NBD/HSP70 family sugar kinase
MEQYILAAAIATLAPGLIIKGITAGVSGAWYLTNRAVYGKQKSQQEQVQEKIQELEKKFEERLLEISNNERNINLKLDKLLKQDYDPNNK